MGRRDENQKVVKMKKKHSVGLGLLLFVFAIYLLIIFVQSVTKEHVSIYEVTENQIADDETIRGVIIRDETLVTADSAGYVNYYVGDGAKVGVRTNVYSLDESGTISEQLAALDNGEITISEEDSRNIRNSISEFRQNFDLSNYNEIQDFRYDLDNTLIEMSTLSLSDRLNQIMDKDGENNSSFQIKKAGTAGIISLSSDDMENLTPETVTPELFEHPSDNWKQLRTSDKIDAGSGVYRLVNSENWSVVIPLTDKQVAKFNGKTSMNVRLKKDDLQMTVPTSVYTVNNQSYAKLDFDKYMIRYLNTRFLDIRFEFNHAKGLKIPNTSIFKKKCYAFPRSFLTQGSEEGGGGTGVFVRCYDKNGKPKEQFQRTEIYYIDSNNNAYIDAALFPPGTTLIPVGTEVSASSLFELNTKTELEGVYVCNDGYCVFHIIDKLYENEEYTIVQNNTQYGLETYDHIILNPKMVKENDILY